MVGKKHHIFFDLDDTMLKTQVEYSKVIEDCAELIVSLINGEATKEDVIAKGLEIDVEASLSLGLTKERFPLSWVKAYKYFVEKSGQVLSSSGEEEIKREANKIYENKFDLYEQVIDTLSEIKDMDAFMYILTAGDCEVQNKRVDDAGLRGFFDMIYVVPSKNPEVMKEIIGGKDNAIMIGNSLRSDIYPALENGMSAIHIDKQTWAYDNYDINKNDKKYHVIEHFQELPELLKSLLNYAEKELA